LQCSKRESVEMLSNSVQCDTKRKQIKDIPGNARVALGSA
jgi:hypothetical protein